MRPTISSSPARRHATVSRRLAGLAVAASAVLVPATAASAHVHVDGHDATRGGYGVLTFRVPTESDTASTVALTVTFPADAPVASVSTQPIPGWTAKVTTATLDTPVETDDGELTTYVSQVRWTADTPADGIHPGQFQLFNASAGPLPDVDAIRLPAVQTYSDGTTVAWNQTATGGAQAEHPAPVLELAPAHEDAAPAAPATASAEVAQAGVAGDGPAWPGVVGLVAGLLGLVLGAAALARTRRASAAGPPRTQQ